MSPPPASPNGAQHHTLVVLVENKAGVLSRVAGLFARRGFNIESLAVAPTDHPEFSRLTIVVDVASAPLEQITKQLDKLVNVVEISELDPRESIERELIVATIDAPDDRRAAIDELITGYGGFVLAEGHAQLTLSFTSSPEKIDEFEERIREFGIVELQRTGRVALPRLDMARTG